MPFPRHTRPQVRQGAVLALVCVAVAMVGFRRWPLRRFLAADRSMEPTLVDGQGLIGIGNTPPRVGELRAFEHPDRADFWLVKRVAAVSGDSMIVESDNHAIPTVDSHTFGPVDVDGSFRIVIRVPIGLMRSDTAAPSPIPDGGRRP